MQIIKNTQRNRFVKNVLLIAGGTTFAQFLNTALTPIITRLYLPEDYGILTLYTSIIGILSIVSSLKYEHGVAITNSDKKAINILVLSICILTVFVSIVFIVFYVLSIMYGKFLFWYLVPLGVFASGLYNIFLQWSLRKKDFKSISKTKITQSIFSNFTKISLGLLKVGPTGLIIGNIIGASVGIRTLSLSLIKKHNKDIFKLVRKKRIYWGVKRYAKFPVYLTPSQLLNNLGIQLPIYFLTSMYGNQLVGYYGLAHTIVNLPTILIGNSIGDVFYSEAVNTGKSHPEKLKLLSINLFKKLLIIGIIPLIILFFFGPNLFSLVFGSNWYDAGNYARILAFLVYARLIFMPISRVFEVYEKQKQVFFIDMIRVMSVLIVFIVSMYFSFNAYITLTLYCLSMILIYFITFIYAQSVINDFIVKKKSDDVKYFV